MLPGDFQLPQTARFSIPLPALLAHAWQSKRWPPPPPDHGRGRGIAASSPVASLLLRISQADHHRGERGGGWPPPLVNHWHNEHRWPEVTPVLFSGRSLS